jgi:hypothetical protein
VDDWISPALLQAVRFLAETTHYDVVVVNYVWCSLLLDAFCEPGPRGARTLRILDTHDAFADRHEVARKAGMRPHWFYTSAAEEGRGLDRADIVLAIQSKEAEHFAAITRARVATIEYAAPPRFLAASGKRTLTVGYLGSGNPWNVRSVEEFDAALAAAYAAPDSVADGKDRTAFRLFGGVTRAVGKLAMFVPLGVMDDVRDAYAEMDLVVNPMVSGTGLKIKTVEALAFGRPVLSTRAGGAGLEAIHPDLTHEDSASLIGRLQELIAQPEEVAVLSLAMQAGYRTFYDGVHTRLRALLESVA